LFPLTISFVRPTFFVTSACYNKQNILQSQRMADLLIDVLRDQVEKQRFHLHEFVIMPDHFHLLVTPADGHSIERSVQFVKGGFSFRAKRELNFSFEVWQSGFHDWRIRDDEELVSIQHYIRMNPVRRGLVASAEEWVYSSLNLKYASFLRPAAKAAASSHA
jgi:putative transposase